MFYTIIQYMHYFIQFYLFAIILKSMQNDLQAKSKKVQFKKRQIYDPSQIQKQLRKLSSLALLPSFFLCFSSDQGFYQMLKFQKIILRNLRYRCLKEENQKISICLEQIRRGLIRRISQLDQFSSDFDVGNFNLILKELKKLSCLSAGKGLDCSILPSSSGQPNNNFPITSQYIQDRYLKKQVAESTWQKIANQWPLTNKNCINCSKSRILINNKPVIVSNIYQNEQIPDTGQSVVVVNYKTYKQDLINAMCATVNCGGGYIMITEGKGQNMKGFEFEDQHKQKEVYDFIRISLGYLGPLSLKNTCQIEKLLVVDNPFQKKLKSMSFIQYASYKLEKQPKWMIKITIPYPKKEIKNFFPCFPPFYTIVPIKSNKFSYQIYLNEGKLFRQLAEESFSSLILKFWAKKHHISALYPCLPFSSKCLPLKQIFHDSSMLKQPIQTQVPTAKYKHKTLIIINSSKYEDEVLKKVRGFIEEKKILHTLQRPYKKFTPNSLRPIWFLTHDCQFNYLLNSLIKNIDEKRYSLAIVTNFLKTLGPFEEQKCNRMKNSFEDIFGDDQMTKKTKIKQKPKKKEIYYGLKNFQQSMFCFIFLDQMNVKCEFLKQYFFVNQL